MSANIYVMVWTPPEHRKQVFVAIADRMLARATDAKVSIDERTIRKPVEYPLDITPTPDVLRGLVASQTHTFGHLSLWTAYQTRHGDILPFFLKIFGDQAIGGAKPGLILGWTNRTDLLKPVFSLRTDNSNFLQDAVEQLLVNASRGAQFPELHNAIKIVCENTEELLLQAIGLLDNAYDTGLVQHGAIYFDTLWESPLRACMTYHRDVREFARDFARIYLHAQNYNIESSDTFGRVGTTIWDLEAEVGAKRKMDLSKQEYFEALAYPSPVREDKDLSLARFLERLDRARAEALASIPADQIRTILKQVIGETPFAWCHDMGERGVMIGTHPFSNFRVLYPRIAELAAVLPSSQPGR